jgi:diaminopimelate epimerase
VRVSVGNPHFVLPVEKATVALARELGPVIENHEAFPNRTNVQFLEKVSRQAIRIEIWERGAGYTLASGSSSCAAATAANKLGWVDREVEVHMPGGVIRIGLQPDGHVLMTGPVTKVAKGEIDPEIFQGL